MLSGQVCSRHCASVAGRNVHRSYRVQAAKIRCVGGVKAWPTSLFRPRHLVTQQDSCCRAGNQTETITQQELLVREVSSHAQHIVELCKKHDLEALIPYMSEMNVVKAVVRQHEAQMAWQKREAQHARQQQSAYGSYNYWPAAMPPCPVPGATPSPTDSTDHRWDGTKQYRDGMPLHPVRPIPQTPDFTAVLDAAQTGDDEHHLLDSFAMRHLILSRPASLETLSSMLLSPELFVQRCQSTSLWGEKCILTFTLKLRSEQELKSGYSKHPNKQPWVLTRVAGEPLSYDPLEAISPQHPPEAIVAAQVQAFKDCDFDIAYALTSPVGRAVAGTRERFRAAMQADFRYQPVLAHRNATSIHRTHSNASTYLEVFSVQGFTQGPSLFIWVATRQLDGLYKNCWLVEYVTPIKDPAIIKALQLGY